MLYLWFIVVFIVLMFCSFAENAWIRVISLQESFSLSKICPFNCPHCFLTSLCPFPYPNAWNSLYWDDATSDIDWDTHTHMHTCKVPGCVQHLQSQRHPPFLNSDSINHLEQGFPWSLFCPQAETTTVRWLGLESHWDTFIGHARDLIKITLC